MGRIVLVVLVVLSGCGSSSDPGTNIDASADIDATSQVDAPQLPALVIVMKGGHRVVRYATVNKADTDRIVYIEETKLAQVPTSGPFPDGSRMLMEVIGGGSFVTAKVGGVWQWGTFNVNGANEPLTTAPNAGCTGCHSNAASELIFTMASLRRFRATQVVEELQCPGSSTTSPCTPSVYQ
jgi:hypothetical protein